MTPNDSENIPSLLKEADYAVANPYASYYLVIPGHVLNLKILPLAKHLYGLIASLCSLKGYCWATNEYLCETMQISSRHLDTLLKILCDHKVIFKQTIQNGMKRRRRIWLSEAVSNNFTVTHCSAPSSRTGLRDGHALECASIDKELIYKEKDRDISPRPPEGGESDGSAPPTPPTHALPLAKQGKKRESPPGKDKDIPHEAIDLSQELYDYLKAQNPKQKAPNLTSWASSFAKALKIDKRTPEEIRSALKWVFENSGFWCKTVQSPDNFRKHFDRIWTEMHPPQNAHSRAETNRKTAYDLKRYLESEGQGNLLIVHKHYISYPLGEGPSFDLPTETFNGILEKRFGIKISNE